MVEFFPTPIVAKKIFNDHEITIDFIETFLGFRPKSVQILNGTIADLKKEREGYFSTTVDVLARLDDGTQVIIEIQVVHQHSFIKRLWTYSCQHLVKDLPNVRDKVKRTHDMYDKISPVYSIALVATQYFDDKHPIHSFVLTAEENGQVLEIPFGEQGEMKKPFEMVIIELNKLSEGKLATNQRLWMEFFANREFSQQQTDAISRAEHLLDRNTWTEEERKMIDQLAYSAANHFGELETSFILGRRRGQEEGMAQGLQKGIQKGRAEGMLDGQLKVARQMLVKNHG
ncbi:Rpn family recombination-promoting nuclease/putative transposase [Streptococcus suis]|uniref:Rpn family recombination-promoting nuclease/putative transposase n=1 Tax=Streptococcus suis TaxID=1307 RepID=UPI0005BCF9C1|nr:Rpn family recombination-promoting nuclease/putative transposase [Streptococcus suis]NQR54482.1 Rpn family recombination-promoting nuclease/putative transposase [Streptococcus suis]CYU86420.1 glycyl-tRNA synthetase subunit alpha [Streptococcus suis]CYV15492.1 glycyl-tRNA synthetase subunit alpha [Streptococcus suis]HEL1794443.1 Rpn family recombination-promoting nuclease/putative transposase [Streptococcus suis]